jgi:hypothetical protein
MLLRFYPESANFVKPFCGELVTEVAVSMILAADNRKSS